MKGVKEKNLLFITWKDCDTKDVQEEVTIWLFVFETVFCLVQPGFGFTI